MDLSIGLITSVIAGAVIGWYYLKYWFGKYFTTHDGIYVDITENTNSEDLWGENLPAPLNGYRLNWSCRILNSRFGQRWVAPHIVKWSLLHHVRKSICDHKPTFYPVKLIPGIEYAKETDRIDHCPLKNHFKKDLKWRPITIDDYVSAYIGNIITPLDIAHDIIAKIKLVNYELHIFCDVHEDLIISQAKESTQRYKSGKPLGPLDGVPIVLKDQINLIGHTVRNGLEYPEYKPCTTDAQVTKRIKAEGMMIVGLVNMHVVGIGTLGTNNSKFHGDCLNPVNPEYYPGGSSSGTAAAVAIGIVPCGIGSDGGGSVRIPAAFCGMSAIKPSAGRISNRGYISGTNSALGPMCNTMVDCAKLYSVIAGPDFENEAEVTFFQPKVQIPLSISPRLDGIKIGVDYDWCGQKKNQKIYDQFIAELDWLEEKGCKIIKIKLHDLAYYHAAHLSVFMQELLSTARQRMETGAKMPLDYYANMAVQAETSYGSDYVQANKIRTKFMVQLETIFNQVDLIATPTQRGGTTKVEKNDAQYGKSDVVSIASHTHFCKMANFTGIPAISTPMGFDDNDMPVGFQLMAKWWDENLLIKVAAAMEVENSYRKPKYYLPNRFL